MIFNYSSKRPASAHEDDDNNDDDDDDDDLFDNSKKGKSSSKKAKIAAKPAKKKSIINDSDDDDDGRKKAAKVDEDDDVEIVQTHAECAKKALEELLAGAGSSSSGAAAPQEILTDDDADEVAKTSKETMARIAKIKGGLEQANKGIDLSIAAAASSSSSSSNQRRSSLPTKSTIISLEERQRKQQEKKVEAVGELYKSLFGEDLLSSNTGASSSSSAKASTFDQGKSIKIKIIINSNHELGLKLFARQRFAEVKNRLSEMTGVVVSKIRLQSDAEDIGDDQTAEDLELEDDYTIEMIIPREEYSNAVQHAKDWKDRPKGGGGGAAGANGTNKPAVAEPPKAEITEINLKLIFAADILKNEEKKDPVPTKVLPGSTLQQLEEKLITYRAKIGLKDELRSMSFLQNKSELRLDKTIRELGCVDGTEIHVQARPISITVSFPEGILATGTEVAVKLRWKDSFQKIVKLAESQKKLPWIYSVDGTDVKSYQYSSPLYTLGMEEGTLVKVRTL